MQNIEQLDELQLDVATVEFLDVVSRARSLKLSGGRNYLNAHDFVKYLGINLQLEPQLSWIAREMCSSPFPLNCQQHRSESNLIYFRDTELNVCTLEHPWTQRYLKMLAIHRLEVYASIHRACSEPTILFHMEYPQLQIACEDCGQRHSTKYCEYCMESFCDFCYDLLHHVSGSRAGHTYRLTAAGSDCSVCLKRQPNVYCKSCLDYFCFTCFDQLHKKGKRFDHSVMKLPPELQGGCDNAVCHACNNSVGNLYCSFCKEFLCLSCFWVRHTNKSERHHYAKLTTVRPLCCQCQATRASVFCDQCRELFCTRCFTVAHAKGNRKMHVFRDAMNLFTLLDETSVADRCVFVLHAITKIQALARGWLERLRFRKQKNFAVMIQKRWRGGQTRRKLVGMMDQLNWRRRVVLNSIVPTNSKHSLAKYHLASVFQEELMKDLVSASCDNEIGPPPHDVGISENAEPLAPPPTTSVQTRLTNQVKQRSKIRRLFNFLKS